MEKLPLDKYFDNRKPNDPATLAGVVSYYVEHRDLPFRYYGSCWPYDVANEIRKREGNDPDRVLTPPATAARIAHLAQKFSEDTFIVLDACCGTGQLSDALLGLEFIVVGFDRDPEMIAAHNLIYKQVMAQEADFNNISTGMKWQLIVSAPPVSDKPLREFFVWLVKNLAERGRAVLLLPKGTVDRTKPRSLKKSLEKLVVLHREDVREAIPGTDTAYEIVVVESAAKYGI